jgi:hypothetical protein
MFEPHEGTVALNCDFDKVWTTLQGVGELVLQTEVEVNRSWRR